MVANIERHIIKQIRPGELHRQIIYSYHFFNIKNIFFIRLPDRKTMFLLCPTYNAQHMLSACLIKSDRHPNRS
jgi:ABC-type long-subunit fatty acid transport system fused permease/ATPase subunit